MSLCDICSKRTEGKVCIVCAPDAEKGSQSAVPVIAPSANRSGEGTSIVKGGNGRRGKAVASKLGESTGRISHPGGHPDSE